MLIRSCNAEDKFKAIYPIHLPIDLIPLVLRLRHASILTQHHRRTIRMPQEETVIRAPLPCRSPVNTHCLERSPRLVPFVEVAVSVALRVYGRIIQVSPRCELCFEVAIPWALCVGPLEELRGFFFVESHGFEECTAAAEGFAPDGVVGVFPAFWG